MPTETEELRLVITLTDNASAGFKAVHQHMAQLGGGAAQAHVERFKRGHAELAKQIKELQELATGGEKAMLGFIGKFGAAGAAVTALGTVVIAGIHGLNEFSSKITELNNKAKVFGVHPAVLKSIEEQLDRIGLGADQADANVARFNEAYAQIGRVGSAEHLKLLDMAGRHRDEMEAGIQSILKEQDPILAMNKAMAQAQVVFNERMKDTNNNLADATEFTKKFLEQWGLDSILRGVQLKPVSGEDRARIDAQTAATKEFYTGIKDLKKEWNDWMDDISTSALSPNGVVVTGLHLAISLTKTLHELWEKPLTKQVAKGTFDTMSFMIPGVNTIKFWKWITDLYQSTSKGEADKKGLGEQLGLDALPKTKGEEGEAKATHLLSSMSDDNEEYKNTMKDNTGQLKRLNDYLAAQQLGINVPPGGGGGGATPGGGGAPASAGPSGPSGPSTGPSSGPGPSSTGPSTGPSSAAPSSSGMGNLGAPGLDPFTTGAKSMGTIGAKTPEAAAATMAGAAAVGPEPAAAVGGKAGTRGGSVYQKLLAAYKKSNLVGTIPPDGARFGFKTGSAEEWAKFGTAVAASESEFNPKAKNLGDPGGSFGVFQYSHSQVPGGNAYDIDASVNAFVRDSESSVQSGRGLRGGILGRRFSTIGSHPQSVANRLAEANRIAGESSQAARDIVDKRSIKTVKVDATGKVAVNIGGGGGDATLGSERLFKPTGPERSTQMVPAKTGPSTFAETAD
jgi:hypothetical protein